MLVQTLHRAEGSGEFAQISIDGPIRIVGDGVLSRPVTVGGLIALTQELHFWILHILSFLFMGTLRWCKRCIGVEEAANLSKFPFTALYGAVGDGVLRRPVSVGGLFALTQALHF